MQTVVELASYLQKARKLMSEQERKDIVWLIACNPLIGDLMQGTGGVRKMRFATGGQGKSGSLRVVYYYYNETIPVFLLTCFGKNQKANVSQAEKNTIKKLVETLKAYGG